jgi:hypothetical protein
VELGISSSLKEIFSDTIFFCFGINEAIGLINPGIVGSAIINGYRTGKVPLQYIIPVKSEKLIKGFRNLVWATPNIPYIGNTKLSEYICFY